MKPRAQRGAYEPRLWPEAVREIRKWHAEYTAIPKPRDICKRFNIDRNRIYDLIAGRSYKDVR